MWLMHPAGSPFRPLRLGLSDVIGQLDPLNLSLRRCSMLEVPKTPLRPGAYEFIALHSLRVNYLRFLGFYIGTS